MLFLGPIVGEFVKAFEDGMAALGYVEGRNVVYEQRAANGNADLLPDRVAEMLHRRVDVIVAINNPTVVAAQKVTRTIPIVMAFPTDPVGSGLVVSLARPGGNTTGLSLQLADLVGKRAQFLKEIVPALSHLSVLWDPTFSGMQSTIRETEAHAARMGLQLQILEARGPGEFESAFT